MRLATQTIFALLLLTCWLPASAQPQPGQAPAAQAAPRPAATAPTGGHTGGLSAAEADRLSALLRDDQRRAELLRTLEALSAASRAQPAAGGSAAAAAAPGSAATPAPAASAPAAGEAASSPAAAGGAAAEAPGAPGAAAAPPAEPLIAPNTVGAQLLRDLSKRVDTVSDTLLGAARSVADLPSLWTGVANLARDPVARARLLDASWKLAVLLGAGFAVEALAVRLLAGPRRRLDAAAAAEGSWTWLRRSPLLVGRLLLDLVPIAGFALAALGLFGVVRPLPTTQLVGLMIGHTYIAARLAFAVARTLFSPRSRSLRLIPCSDEAAAAWLSWLRLIMSVGVAGYALAEAGLLFGLPWAAYDAIINLTLLAMSLFVVQVVLRHRHAVADALRATPLEPGEQPDRARHLLRSARNQLANVWHILVILWLFAGWAVWALAVEDGFIRLLRATAMAVVVALVGKGLDEGISRLLDRLLSPTPELAKRYPGLPARAATYVPLTKAALSVLIACAGIVLLLETWGVDALGWFAAGTLGGRLLGTLGSIGVTLLLALAVWEAANTAIQRRLARLSRDSHAARSARVRTLLPMLRTVLGGAILVFVVLNALSQLGVNVAPLLAGAGVIGVAVGFGAQTLVRDVITGIFLLFEDAVAVGDVVQLGGLSGVVEHLSIRAIKLRAQDGSVHIIPFSAVTTVTNMTRDFAFAVLDVTVSYDEDPDRVAEVLREISKEVRAEPKFAALIRDDIDVFGVEKLADSGLMIRARVKTEPAARWSVGREFNRRIKQRFDERGIQIPRPQPMV
ncbi:MAG TPA: mechanosensitive ion channel domain-containing protein, partial [Acetobacteraceae bacterium]|nr:mechanosensitive ion channel domain-containing protein [Acetobacteraceae bacterium]